MGADAQARMPTHALYAQDAMIHHLALSMKHHTGMADTGCVRRYSQAVWPDIARHGTTSTYHSKLIHIQ